MSRHPAHTPRQSDAPSAGATDALARGRSPYTLGEKVRRALWMLVGQPLMRITFHDWYRVRVRLLNLFGAYVDRDARVRPTVKVEQPWNLRIGPNTMVGDHVILYCLGTVSIGANCSISQFAHLCAGTHDYTRVDMRLVKLPIVVEDEVWIAADAFIGPGVTIGQGAVIGARSSVYKSLPGWKVYAGNPVRALKDRVLTGERGERPHEL